MLSRCVTPSFLIVGVVIQADGSASRRALSESVADHSSHHSVLNWMRSPINPILRSLLPKPYFLSILIKTKKHSKRVGGACLNESVVVFASNMYGKMLKIIKQSIKTKHVGIFDILPALRGDLRKTHQQNKNQFK